MISSKYLKCYSDLIIEMLDKFDVELELDELVLNNESETGYIKLDDFKEYGEENVDGETIHVFKGQMDDGYGNNINFEIIINPKDKENDGAVSITYLGYTGNQYEIGDGYHRTVFTKDAVISETS